MFVNISSSGDGPQLMSVDDLTSLAVRIDTSVVDPGTVGLLLRSVGAGDAANDHAWLDVSWLRAEAGTPGVDWPQRFAAMLQYARAHGWLSPDGLRVRAHIEQPITP